MKKLYLIALCIVLVSFVSANAGAQTPGVKSKPLLKTTLSDDPTKEVSMTLVEFPPGGTSGRHVHPGGDEYAVILQGSFELSAEGRETRRLSTGDVFHTPRGLVHENRNVGDTQGRVVITIVGDKGKPFVMPAK